MDIQKIRDYHNRRISAASRLCPERFALGSEERFRWMLGFQLAALSHDCDFNVDSIVSLGYVAGEDWVKQQEIEG